MSQKIQAQTGKPDRMGLVKRFIPYYKPHKTIFGLDMGASLLMSLLAIIYPIITRRMLNDFIPNQQVSAIVWSGLLLLAIYGARFGLKYFVQYQGHMMGVRMQAQMRREIFEHYEELPYSFFDANETGRLMSRVTNDLQDVSELAHHGPENIIICTITIIASFIYLSFINIWLALITFFCVPILTFVAVKMRQRQHEAFAKSRAAVAEINATIQSSISGIRVTKAFTNDEEEMRKFDKGNELYKEARRDAYSAMAKFNSTTSFITDFFNVVVLLSGGIFLIRGKISFADYSAFIVSVSTFISPVNTLIQFFEQFEEGVTGFERFVQIMDIQPESDPQDAEDIGRAEGHIELRSVSSAYDDGSEVLSNVSLDIPTGKTVALVGPSGGGKTTICHLIPHFYDISKGEILLDGKNINKITLESLRRQIGIVQQDVFLFNASVKDNILYGRPDATMDEVIEAAKRADIHDYVMQMENGYDTIIGERGVRLSGGQKQRLSIARVFLKNPPILILDEATSALDNATERLIQGALAELAKGRTCIVVAHRLSTIKNADTIAVVEGGRIAELGSHSKLLEKNGKYAELYNSQLF